MHLLRPVIPCIAILLAAPGCSDSHAATDGGADATIRFDASRPEASLPDAGMDASPLPDEGAVGSACTTESDCDQGICIGEDRGFPDGYCTGVCNGPSDCPDGSACVRVGRGTSICLDRCDPAAEPKRCRDGYGCATSPFLGQPVCMPGCEVDSDCEAGKRCDTEGGFAGAGQCYDPGAETGGPCTSESDCPAEHFCLGEDFGGAPGGLCIGVGGCDVDTDSGCPADAHCLPVGRGERACFDGCSSDADCRPGYRCEADESYPERRVCLPGCTEDSQCTVEDYVCYRADGTCRPPFDPAEYGTVCAGRHGGCFGGSCLYEYTTGLPGSYCAYEGCDPSRPDAMDGCPGEGVCWQADADGPTLCMAPCDEDADCRDGYACRPVDADRPERGSACLPACTSDAQCANDGFRCDTTSGRCMDPSGGG